MGRRLPTDHAGVWLAWPWQHPHLTPPHPRWVDGTRLCAGSRCSKPPTPEGRLQLRQPGAWPNHRYVMRRFLLWRHFCGIGCPTCSPGASCLPTRPASLCSVPGSLALTHFSLSLSLSNPVTATSTGEQHFLLRLSLSGIQPWGALRPSRSRQPLNSHFSKAAYRLGDLGQVT